MQEETTDTITFKDFLTEKRKESELDELKDMVKEIIVEYKPLLDKLKHA